jgi:hypothetical protein
MPTDIAEAIARKRKATKDVKRDIMLLSACLFIFFAHLALVLGDDRFAQAIELIGRY